MATELTRILGASLTDIDSTLASFEPKSTFDDWFNTYRGIEELINLPSGLNDDALCNRILGLELLNVQRATRELPAIYSGLPEQFTRPVATRLLLRDARRRCHEARHRALAVAVRRAVQAR